MEPEIVCNESAKRDHRPEYCQYRDEGCELSGSCLQCPLKQCIYDRPQGKRRLIKAARDSNILGLFKQGKNTEDLATLFGVSKRTIQRVVKIQNPKSQIRNPNADD